MYLLLMVLYSNVVWGHHHFGIDSFFSTLNVSQWIAFDSPDNLIISSIFNQCILDPKSNWERMVRKEQNSLIFLLPSLCIYQFMRNANYLHISAVETDLCITLFKAHSAVLPYLLPLPLLMKFRGREGWPKIFRGGWKSAFLINFN